MKKKIKNKMKNDDDNAKGSYRKDFRQTRE